MTIQEPIRLFVAHAFSEHEDFHKVIEYVESKESFQYVNTASFARPEGATSASLQEELRKQIGLSEVVIVPVNIYKAHADVIDYVIRVAENFGTKVMGVRSFGVDAELPKSLRDHCAEVVEWDARKLIANIKKLARNEAIPEYEVVEFTLD